MKKDNILVTGGAGFIGSNFIAYLLEKYPNYHVINLDALTYAGNIMNLQEIQLHERYEFIKGDIRNQSFLLDLFKHYDIQNVIHFAAESHVDNSINNPIAFTETNVLGTLNLLEAARSHWMLNTSIYKEGYDRSRFHHISTDEVYGTLGSDGYFTERTPFAPNSPYSASKASSDMIVRSYFHTYGMNVVTSNCSNNYGPKQHDEKLIPTLIRKALQGEPLPIYGDGQNIRDWLYVEDHCRAIDLVFHKGKTGETYLIGGKNERTNLEIAYTICLYLDRIMPKTSSYKDLIEFVQDRPGHDFRYAIDSSKIEEDLGWKPRDTFDIGIIKTMDWYIKKYTESGVRRWTTA
ncbi:MULTISPECIES: dTDP-glucose 4,6-dehydratase [Bacillaceae]|uniref:dTDP-glucose 4,6-dehydratase n=1 Tax=Bacillaceae TaxID=186817 RepID=UPI000BFB870E|nr:MULTISPECIES: dTDP-glucose 4,6-dehydratase [Bacillaceae]PGT82990.1 dTDP-glucose 4,6-dehydratase [Bacillus sp. AFS040349]UGB29490.1 dTDP-glucose 4,6-dehydratase [Metabacillus sp. B2-18]